MVSADDGAFPVDGKEDGMETMSWVDWTVILAGAAAVAWVNWYFFIAPGRSR